jgi:NAD(P)H-hydrate epimerase
MASPGLGNGELMRRAGRAAFEALRHAWPSAPHIAVLCGPGNNGGDGYVLATEARAEGLDASVYFLSDPDQLTGDAAGAWRRFRDEGGRACVFEGKIDPGAHVIVDAMLGTGLSRPPEGAIGRAIEAANAHSAPVLAVDIPSGLFADTGAAPGPVIAAQRTVTFIGMKLGLLTGEGPEVAGEIVFRDLGVPAETYQGVTPACERLDRRQLAGWLPPRTRTAHKGAFGHVLVVGGNRGMAGAARMAGEAALRAGAGLVSVATHPEHAASLNAGRPELMCIGVNGPEALDPLLDRATVVALGPGLGQDGWARALHSRVLAAGLPVVLDADGLNLLAANADTRDNWVLTPHPGEAARLLGCETREIQADRPRAVADIAARHQAVVILKGAGTLVAGGDRPLRVCSDGNPGMASGGMGDVLTGLVAGLAAQGLALADAAAAGVLAHALAGDAAAMAGERGLLAGDLLEVLRRQLNPGR